MKPVAPLPNNVPRIFVSSAAQGARVAIVVRLILLWLGVAGVARAEEPSAPSPPSPNVLAHGSGDTYWFGFVTTGDEKGDPDQTRLFLRSRELDGWQPLPRLGARAAALADYKQVLAVRLKSGQWVRMWRGDSASGQPLPGSARVSALAGTDSTLWAIADVEGGVAGVPKLPSTTGAMSTTSPTTSSTTTTTTTAPATTAEATATTAPAMRPATTRPATPVLFALDRGVWTARADVPAALHVSRPPEFSLRMAMLGNDPIVAARDGNGGDDRRIVVMRYSTSSQRWEDLGDVTTPADTTAFDLLVAREPMLWIAPRAGAGALYVLRNKTWAGPAPLTLADGASVTDRAVAVASERVRLIFLRKIKDVEHYFEQKYELAPDHLGEKIGEATEIQLPAISPDSTITNWLQITVMVALFAVIAGSMRRRAVGLQRSGSGGDDSTGAAVAAASRLALAPIGLRFVAGVIDLSPVLITAGIIGSRYYSDNMDEMMQGMFQAAVQKPLLLATFAVIAHTMIAELATGRSIGKLLLGLRVVTLEGKRPGPGAIVVRNLLRIVDLTLYFTLFMILYSPLRQRVGDIAAGTVVVKAVDENPNDESAKSE